MLSTVLIVLACRFGSEDRLVMGPPPVLSKSHQGCIPAKAYPGAHIIQITLLQYLAMIPDRPFRRTIARPPLVHPLLDISRTKNQYTCTSWLRTSNPH